MSAGGLTVLTGSMAVTGNMLVSAGALSLTASSVNTALDVSASQAGYTGNVMYGSVAAGLPSPVNLLLLRSGTTTLFQVGSTACIQAVVRVAVCKKYHLRYLRGL